jgi:adenylylsulfate kinase-like enzyme
MLHRGEEASSVAPDVSVPRGRVFWITGLSSSGKTTIGQKLWSRLREAGRPAIFLDGDELRQAIAEDLGHVAADRRHSAAFGGTK